MTSKKDSFDEAFEKLSSDEAMTLSEILKTALDPIFERIEQEERENVD